MLRSRIKNRYRRNPNSRLYQGDILKDLTFVVGDASPDTEKDHVTLEYAVILSQDCDIEQDFNSRKKDGNNDKYLRSLLVCPAYSLEKFALGEQIDNWPMRSFKEKEVEKIKNNDEYKRYHYLAKFDEYIIPELVLDFKHFFTLPRDFLYSSKRRVYLASLSELFREELSQRFSGYLCRIGLPELKK